jgi:hypothetical protein
VRRIQKELGYLSPDEYEAAWRQANIGQADSAKSTLEPVGVR